MLTYTKTRSNFFSVSLASLSPYPVIQVCPSYPGAWTWYPLGQYEENLCNEIIQFVSKSQVIIAYCRVHIHTYKNIYIYVT